MTETELEELTDEVARLGEDLLRLTLKRPHLFGHIDKLSQWRDEAVALVIDGAEDD